MIGNITKIITLFIMISSLVFSLNAKAVNLELVSYYIQNLNEFTGVLTFGLFALATLILPLRFLHRYVRKITDKNTPIRRNFRIFQPIYKGLHFVVGVSALGFITFHAYLAFEGWNTFLIIGLLMIWTNILPGLFYYSKFFNDRLSEKSYKIHVSIIFRILIIAVLYSGHMLAV